MRTWLVSLLIYTVFFIWYTDLRGPLSDAEIEKFLDGMRARGSSPEMLVSIERFMREDTGRI